MRTASFVALAVLVAGVYRSAESTLLPAVEASPGLLSSPINLSEAVSAELGAALDKGVVRSRVIGLDVRRLPNPAAVSSGAAEASIALDLFPDVAIKAIFERFDSNSTGVTWVGHVEGVGGSTVTLVYGDRLMHGSVIMPSGTFQIRPAPEDVRDANRPPLGELHVVSQVDQGALPREAEPLMPSFSEAEIAAARDVAKSDIGDVIDVMIVYTPTAEQAVGGAAAMTNLINLGLSETNTSYANSDVRQRVRLVHSALVNYTESSEFATTLTALRAGGVPGVASLREQYRADLVMMLIHPARPDACGIAYIQASVTAAFQSSAFSVTDTSCVSPGLTMAHEWGHNMGAQHDWYVSASVLPYSYAHGHVNTRSGQRWRTIMSYNDICAAQGFACTRLLAWANPDTRLNPLCTAGNVTCRGTLWNLPGEGTGIAAGTRSNCSIGVLTANECDADDHRALNNTALNVANFRQSLIAGSAAR